MKIINFEEFKKIIPKNKALILDLEYKPSLGYIWGLWNNNISLNQLNEEGYIMSIALKWLGVDGILYLENRHDEEKKLLKYVRDLLDIAEFTIVHNSAYDIKTIKGRLIKHNIPPYSPIKEICTLKSARKEFRLISNKLEYLANYLDCEIKKDTNHGGFGGFELWVQCIKQNDKAWEAMKHYNVYDILTLEQVYLKMRPYMSNHPIIYNGEINKEDEVEARGCPRCGSSDLVNNGTYTTKSGIRKRRFKCKSCHSFFIHNKAIKVKNNNRIVSI